jgi:cytoskeleton protein RodZ
MGENNEFTANGAAEPPSEASLGTLLRGAREARELSIEKIADELRIEPKVLEALEDDRLSEIKMAPVFVKGYIKQYGRQLGLDYELLRSAYQAQVDGDDVDLQPNRSIFLRDERQITVWIVAALALLLVAVVLFIWWIGDEPQRAAVMSEGTQSVPNNVTSLAPTAPAASRSNALPVQRRLDTGGSQTAQRNVAGVPEAASVSSSGTSIELARTNEVEAEPAEAVEPVVTSAPTAPAVRPAGAIAVQFQFSADSWLELTDARGERMFYDIAAADSEEIFYPVPPVTVLLGNADAVAIAVEGEAFAVPTQGRRGNLVTFVIARPQD